MSELQEALDVLERKPTLHYCGTDAPLKINLGCGRKKRDGFVNVDFQGEPDVHADVFAVLPFDTECASEVHAYHVAEHCYRWQIEGVLREWVRLLKPDGLLVLELPCLDKVLAIFRHFMESGDPVPVNLTMWGLFGDPGWKDTAMCHRWCYSEAEMTALMEKCGLVVESKTPQTHQPVRDMRLEGRKWQSQTTAN